MNVLSGHSDNRVVAGEIVRLLMGYEIPPSFAQKSEELLDAAYPSRRYRTPKPGAAFARAGDPGTAKVAATQLNVAKLEHDVLQGLARIGTPITMHDFEIRTGMSYRSVTPRMKPLRLKGMVAQAGIDRSAGRPRTLFSITDRGRSFLMNGGAYA